MQALDLLGDTADYDGLSDEDSSHGKHAEATP
jgi:hypothetical protein